MVLRMVPGCLMLAAMLFANGCCSCRDRCAARKPPVTDVGRRLRAHGLRGRPLGLQTDLRFRLWRDVLGRVDQ